MSTMRLNPEQLQVESYSMSASEPVFDPFCCTGCDSGCGINPTAGYCESGGGKTGEPETIAY